MAKKKMPEDTVDVVITTCGRALEMLREAVDSAVNQTYPIHKIILVDDNGDGTHFQSVNRKEFEGRSDILFLANHMNMGAQYSRNRGILNATAKYVAFLDDDDLWCKNKIEKQMEIVSEDTGMVCCDGYIFYNGDVDQAKRKQKTEDVSQKLTFDDLLYENYIGGTSQAMIRRDVFAAAGLFDHEMPARQDYDMWIRISKYYQIRRVEEPLFFYRQHEGNQITKDHRKSLVGYKRILHKYSSDYKSRPYAKAKAILRVCLTYLQLKKIFHAVACLIWAFFVSPRCTLKTMKRKAHIYAKKRKQTI